MNATVHQRSYLDSWIARAIALVIAIALGAYLIFGLGDELVASFTGEDMDEERIVSEDSEEISPALRACLDDRVGDVDRMRDEGVLTEQQYAEFRRRAVSLCEAQQPV